jgi:guanylate kinase
MSHWDEFEYVVVNETFERAVGELVRVVDGQGEDLAAHRESLRPLLAELVG